MLHPAPVDIQGSLSRPIVGIIFRCEAINDVAPDIELACQLDNVCFRAWRRCDKQVRRLRARAPRRGCHFCGKTKIEDKQSGSGTAHPHRYSAGHHAARCVRARTASRRRTCVDVIERAARKMARMVGS